MYPNTTICADCKVLYSQRSCLIQVTIRIELFKVFFCQLSTWTSSGKSVDTSEKSALKLVKLPNLKVICSKLMKIQILKVAKFYSRLYGGWHKLPPPPHQNVCKFSQLAESEIFARLRSRLRRITFKLFFLLFSNVRGLFPVVVTDFPQLVHVKS